MPSPFYRGNWKGDMYIYIYECTSSKFIIYNITMLYNIFFWIPWWSLKMSAVSTEVKWWVCVGGLEFGERSWFLTCPFYIVWQKWSLKKKQYIFWKISNPNTPSKFHCKQVFLNLFILLARIGSAVHYANLLGEPTVRQMPGTWRTWLGHS